MSPVGGNCSTRCHKTALSTLLNGDFCKAVSPDSAIIIVRAISLKICNPPTVPTYMYILTYMFRINYNEALKRICEPPLLTITAKFEVKCSDLLQACRFLKCRLCVPTECIWIKKYLLRNSIGGILSKTTGGF